MYMSRGRGRRGRARLTRGAPVTWAWRRQRGDDVTGGQRQHGGNVTSGRRQRRGDVSAGVTSPAGVTSVRRRGGLGRRGVTSLAVRQLVHATPAGQGERVTHREHFVTFTCSLKLCYTRSTRFYLKL